MGHEVKAVLAPAQALLQVAQQHGLQRPCPLNSGWALMPLSDEVLDTLFAQGTGSPVEEGFIHLGPRLLDWLKENFPGGAAYIETGYFGGSGGQCAVAVRDGRVVCSPACGRSGEINIALHVLGVVDAPGQDAFDTLGLGRHRLTSDWADAAEEATAGNWFSLHWSRVPNPPADALPGVQVHALWPAPVNPDACFTDAGFTDFQDADGDWDAQADALLQRVLDQLQTHFGEAVQPSPPVAPPLPWYRRFFAAPPPPKRAPLQQLADAMHDDNLPLADVRFGSSGARLRASAGHWLLWVDWPSSAPLGFEALVQQLAQGKPVQQTELDWRVLWPGAAFKSH